MNQTRSIDPFAQFKAVQKEAWALFAPLEVLTTKPAARLVHFAQVENRQDLLDVGCGTGVVAITSARTGARVKALDLSPVLLERAQMNAKISGVEIDFVVGDAETLPYRDAEFDVVLSQFGHMFAPRPEIAASEMLRVLKPGGTIAFSTWPPELFTGRMFALTAKYLPPPTGLASPALWGDVETIRKRLGDRVQNLSFYRDVLQSPALSPQHFRNVMEKNVGPILKLVESLKNDAATLASFRTEFETLINEFFEDNSVQQHFLMSRATKV